MKRRIVIYLFLILFFFLPLAVWALDLGDAFNPSAGNPLAGIENRSGYNPNTNPRTVFVMAAEIIATLLSLLGVFFVGLMIYGGYMWMTAMGQEQKATKAKDTITAAVIGLLIIISAYAISYFVIKMLTEKALTEAETTQEQPVITPQPESENNTDTQESQSMTCLKECGDLNDRCIQGVTVDSYMFSLCEKGYGTCTDSCFSQE